MPLFSDALLADLQRLKGAEHSFLKQLSAPDGEPARRRLQHLSEQVGAPVTERWQELLSSLDNRRFFQGYAEAMVCGVLLESGWRVPDLAWPGPSVQACTPSGQCFNVLTLAFIRQVRPEPDQQALRRLLRALNRVNSRTRIAIHVQRWLPHDFDPEPVRRAVELWLRDVDRHGTQDRYAVYSDEHVSLEFALTGERARRSQGVVAFTIGPCSGRRTLEIVESRILHELDTYRLSPRASQPVLLACVTEQPWQLSRGWLRELLYGKAIWQTTTGDPAEVKIGYRLGCEPGLFRDSLYRTVGGAIFMDRVAGERRSRAYLSPWTEHPLTAADLSISTLDVIERKDRDVTMTWRL